MPDIKSLLDDIINDTNNSYTGKAPIEKSNSVGVTQTHNNYHPVTFDRGKFREKLSLYVLSDIVHAMMHDETKDLDGMIDESIMRHINSNYNGTCYGYLCGARDRLKSPLVGDIIQEIDDKVDEVEDELNSTKDDALLNGKIDTRELLKQVSNGDGSYNTFRERVGEKVTEKVIEDVSNVIADKAEYPVFDKVDNFMKTDKSDDNDEQVGESVILKICSAIVTECAVEKNPITTEEGLNRAIIEYCIAEMDFLFKADPKESIYAKYKI